MPDRYGENPDHIDRRADVEVRTAAIRACELCDEHGYRGTAPCDHEDHTAAARRGMDLIRQTMGWTQP